MNPGAQRLIDQSIAVIFLSTFHAVLAAAKISEKNVRIFCVPTTVAG
jgi:hypothetical protein